MYKHKSWKLPGNRSISVGASGSPKRIYALPHIDISFWPWSKDLEVGWLFWDFSVGYHGPPQPIEEEEEELVWDKTYIQCDGVIYKKSHEYFTSEEVDQFLEEFMEFVEGKEYEFGGSVSWLFKVSDEETSVEINGNGDKQPE